MILLIDVISPCGIFMNSSTGHHTFCLMRGLLAQLIVGTRAGQVSRQGKLASLVKNVGIFARYSTTVLQDACRCAREKCRCILS